MLRKLLILFAGDRGVGNVHVAITVRAALTPSIA